MVEADRTQFNRALATELHGARRAMEELAVRLCLDPVVSARHAEPLQEFDLLAQIIGEVATVLQHDQPDGQAMNNIRLDALRERIVQSITSCNG